MHNVIEAIADLKKPQRWDVETMSREELYLSFQVLNQKMNAIYQFVLGYNEYMNSGHNYDSDLTLTMLEIHLLTEICDQPDSTVTSLASAWNRSRSATSQTVKRLIDKGLVTRENNPANRKVFYLRPTEEAIQLSDRHKQYDVEDTIKTIKRMMHDVSFEDIDAMFRCLDVYNEILHTGPHKAEASF